MTGLLVEKPRYVFIDRGMVNNVLQKFGMGCFESLEFRFAAYVFYIQGLVVQQPRSRQIDFLQSPTFERPFIDCVIRAAFERNTESGNVIEHPVVLQVDFQCSVPACDGKVVAHDRNSNAPRGSLNGFN